MVGWLRGSPGVTRAIVLALSALLVAEVSTLLGMPVQWGTAVIVGAAVAIAQRWPIVMQGTGISVVFVTGLRLEVLWHHGLGTAIIAVLVEFALRMVVLYQGRYYWEWYRPVIILCCFITAYGVQVLLQGPALPLEHTVLPHLETWAFAAAFTYWVLLNASWVAVKIRLRGRSRTVELIQCIEQTWWVPVLFVLVASPLEMAHYSGYPVDVFLCIFLIYVQYLLGNAFTVLNQDAAVAKLVRSAVAPTWPQRNKAHRVMKVAHTLGRAVELTSGEMRILGYAGMLQELGTGATEQTPLWCATPPTADERLVLRRQVETAASLVDADGALQDVAAVIRMRFASYDGQGYPAVAGDSIPLVAQVLHAANAVVSVASESLESGDLTIAVNWLRTNASDRFGPKLRVAMAQVVGTLDPVVDIDGGVPEAVQQLQGLVGTDHHPSRFLAGMRQIFRQLRGSTGLVPDLPSEVQAMARLATYFASSSQADQAAHIVAEAVGQLFNAKVAVALVENERDEFNMVFRATSGLHNTNLLGHPLELAAGMVGRALLDKVPVQVSDIREVQNRAAQEVGRLEGVRSALFVPLIHRSRTMGLMMVGATHQHWFTPREIGLMQLLAGQAAAALENARLIAQAEERLEHISKLKAFTDSLLDNLSSKILVVDPEGLVVMANHAARRRFGAETSLVMGQALPPQLSGIFQVERALLGEVQEETDVPWGSAILEVTCVPLVDGRGVLQGAMCVARDVTQVRAMEQQVRRVEKLAAIGELSAGAAHEIRNPLTSIRGFIQLLQAKANHADGDYFQIILNEIDRIDWIIRDMLLLARPSEVVRVETDVAALLEEMILMHQPELERQNITVEQQYAPDARKVAVDPKMFRQLLLNLVLNGMQAMPYGGTLSLSLERRAGGEVAVIVSDTGVGISPENLKRLFVPFFTTKEEGTGLGLALCYSIVQAHGGRIDVQSTVGLGTTFTISLPGKLV